MNEENKHWEPKGAKEKMKDHNLHTDCWATTTDLSDDEKTMPGVDHPDVVAAQQLEANAFAERLRPWHSRIAARIASFVGL